MNTCPTDNKESINFPSFPPYKDRLALSDPIGVLLLSVDDIVTIAGQSDLTLGWVNKEGEELEINRKRRNGRRTGRLTRPRWRKRKRGWGAWARPCWQR